MRNSAVWANTGMHWSLIDKQTNMHASALAVGVAQPDVEIVVHVGCPPILEEMLQEFGRAGRDGHPGRGVTLYYERWWFKDICQAMVEK